MRLPRIAGAAVLLALAFSVPARAADVTGKWTSVRIEYAGQLTGDEIKFTRKVGDFATEQLVAKRAK